MLIGFAYDKPEVFDGQSSEVEDVSAEYEDAKTIQWISNQLGTFGEVIHLPWEKSILPTLLKRKPDVVLNITEAVHGRNRESLVPAILETLKIPYTGSDAVALGVSLDKNMTKIIAKHMGIRTPGFLKLSSLDEYYEKKDYLHNLSLPLIAKPNTGGSSMGIRMTSRIDSHEKLQECLKWLFAHFDDDILVEEFVDGREFTVSLLGNNKGIQIFPIAEIVINDGSHDQFHSYESKSTHEKTVVCPAKIGDEIKKQMERVSVQIFNELGCRDLSRVDFRIDLDGNVQFLEINPLPGLSPFYSIYPVQARAAGIDNAKLIHKLIGFALSRANKKGMELVV